MTLANDGHAASKAAMRPTMRALRRSLDDPGRRSAAIWAEVEALPEVAAAAVVMAFTSVAGEPDTRPLLDWCHQSGRVVILPEDSPPPDPSAPDVIVVPGLAFTRGGDRLGQGGGWYDRFLVRRRDDCAAIGVCFDVQLVDEVPRGPHDVVVDVVVTDAGTWRGGGRQSPRSSA